ncbi:hypothetical protein FHG87_021176 [Trinorchestia longiramus]|nr:hypothetical protein FHG87_021176 [Trinorchestia longiramus]
MRANALGGGQKIITYCLFGNYATYASGFAETLQKIKQSYPGWVIRLYTEPQQYTKELLPLQVRYPNLYICDVANLPGSIRDVTGVDPRLWRVAALGDELVDVFLSRDLDAMMIDREIMATEEFLKSGRVLHIMRDHIGHPNPILTGMFGVNQTASNMSLLHSIRNKLFAKNATQTNDQELLKLHLFPELNSSMVAHDSYFCERFPGTVPFPTRRLQRQFVGNRRYRQEYSKDSISKVCPPACRPPEHQNWRIC